MANPDNGILHSPYIEQVNYKFWLDDFQNKFKKQIQNNRYDSYILIYIYLNLQVLMCF